MTALLHAVIASHNDVKTQALNHMQHMLEQFILARHRLFGASSEQSTTQGRLFDEAEVLAAGSTGAQDSAPLPPESERGKDKPADKPARGKRAPLPPELKRVDVVHDVPAAERTCPCGAPMVEIGQDVSEQLDIVPMQVRVLRHIRKRYGCPGSTHAPVTAPLPAQPLPKSNASADFLAMLLIAKFIDGLPLARFEYVLGRHGVAVPRQTLARWVIGAARLLQPLHNLMRDALLDGSFIHIDETVVQVLKEPGKKPTSNSYMWVQTGGPPGKQVVLFDYDPSRSAQVPVRLLSDYRGYLMTDGYDGYNALARTNGIEHLACWAHVRRRFVDAVKVQPEGRRGLADEAVALIGRLYGIEREYKGASDTVRLQARQEHSLPALTALRAWLDKTLPGVTPKSALGTALSYMRDYWSRLTRYTERGDLPIDNNRCENAIRPFVVGRKAWLFSDTTAGANASAVIYSLLETAKANGLEPYAWLRQVLRDLPAAKTVDDIEALLPWNLTLADLTDENATDSTQPMGQA
ncbi:IS66 family transposase [Massilia psychrophila]|nr:IS66 family transposase [Massilia psychrophila]